MNRKEKILKNLEEEWDKAFSRFENQFDDVIRNVFPNELPKPPTDQEKEQKEIESLLNEIINYKIMKT